MLAMLEDDDFPFAAMCAGARGHILQGADKAEVLRTVKAVASGEALFGQAIARRLTGFFHSASDQGVVVTPSPELAQREREVLTLISLGLSNLQISSKLTISC